MYGQTFRIYLYDTISCLKHGKPLVNSELAPRNNSRQKRTVHDMMCMEQMANYTVFGLAGYTIDIFP